MDRDANGKLNGNYDDYQGSHTLVQIMVNQNGKLSPFLLDPQYMDEPVTLEEYFIKTTGQICKKSSAQKNQSPQDLTSCYYKEEPQNVTTESVELYSLFNTAKSRTTEEEFTRCGWSSSRVKTGINIAPKWGQIHKNDSKIVCTNSDTPQIFKGKDVSLSTSKELILNFYENYSISLKNQLEHTNEQIKLTSEFPSNPDSKEILEGNIKFRESLIYSMKHIENKIKEVKKNLSK
jgi:hypothetical protein